MSSFFSMLAVIAMIMTPFLLVILLVRASKKKPVKKLGLFLLICVLSILPLIALSMATKCDHEYEIIKETEPTCLEDGEIHKRCSLCKDEDIEYVDALPHEWVTVGTFDATCTSNGYIVEKCEVCSTTQETDTSAALGHSMEEVSRIEPTEDLDGEIITRCKICGHEENEALSKDGSVSGDDGFIQGEVDSVEGESLPNIETDNLVNELMEIGFTTEEAEKYREVFLKCGVNSIAGAEAASTTATIDDLIAYRVILDDKRTLMFTIDRRELFYIALNGTDVYDTDKGGFLISIDDVHIPETKITLSTKDDLELKTRLLLEPYFVKALWFSDFAFGRSDNNYMVRCEVYAQNRLGVKDTVTAFVYYEYDGSDFVVTAISIDGVRYK